MNKQIGNMMEEFNFKLMEMKLKQDQSNGFGKNLLKSGTEINQKEGLDPKKLENALNEWLQKVEV